MALLKRSKKPETRDMPRQSAPDVAPLPAWIRWGRWGVPLVALLLIGGVVAFTRSQSSVPLEFKGGAVVSSRQQAPDFTLTDHNGQTQQLSSFRGRPVALTFVYTNCIDICPLIAWNMHLAYEQLGGDANKIALLAVTVDPERDTPAQMRAFSETRQLTNQWHFLTGVRPALERVWRAYGIQTQGVDSDGNVIPESDIANAKPAQIEHAAPMFLIDKQGNVRMLLPIDFAPETLVHNMKVLLAES